ncbi:MAG: glycosyltransferase family 1 protein [Planctomycetota bacterium]|nr:MAG: glycosyltransferase family 1 protein [Planctomycetota bacterium]
MNTVGPAVLHLDTGRSWRGGQAQTLALVSGMLARGLRCALVGAAGGALAQRAREEGIEVVPMRLRGEFDLWAAWRIARGVRHGGFSVVHAHSAHALSIGLLARLLLRRSPPRVVGARRVDYSIYRHSFLGLNRVKYRGADALVAVSQRVREVLIADGIEASRVHVVHDGIDTEAFAAPGLQDAARRLRRQWGLEPGHRVVGNVAALVGHKGQRHLLNGFARLLRQLPEARLVVLGEGPLEPVLRAQAEQLGLTHAVRWAGRIPPETVPAALWSFDVVAHSSTEEGLGSAVLEAMAAARPVVASAAGGLPEVIVPGETGLLVPPGDPEALAVALQRLLRRTEEARRLGARAQRWVRVHGSRDAMVEATLAVYRRLEAGGEPVVRPG